MGRYRNFVVLILVLSTVSIGLLYLLGSIQINNMPQPMDNTDIIIDNYDIFHFQKIMDMDESQNKLMDMDWLAEQMENVYKSMIVLDNSDIISNLHIKGDVKNIDKELSQYMIKVVKNGNLTSFLEVGNNLITTTIISVYFKRFGLEQTFIIHSFTKIPIEIEDIWNKLNLTINSIAYNATAAQYDSVFVGSDSEYNYDVWFLWNKLKKVQKHKEFHHVSYNLYGSEQFVFGFY